MAEHRSRFDLRSTGFCSFCGMGADEVLVVGRRDTEILVCGRCIDLCREMFATGRARAEWPRGIDSCSFCDQPGVVDKLIAGPTIAICDECTKEACAVMVASA